MKYPDEHMAFTSNLAAISVIALQPTTDGMVELDASIKIGDFPASRPCHTVQAHQMVESTPADIKGAIEEFFSRAADEIAAFDSK